MSILTTSYFDFHTHVTEMIIGWYFSSLNVNGAIVAAILHKTRELEPLNINQTS